MRKLDERWENAAIVGNLITGNEKDKASHHRHHIVLGANWSRVGRLQWGAGLKI